jgi:hypothetical protein
MKRDQSRQNGRRYFARCLDMAAYWRRHLRRPRPVNVARMAWHEAMRAAYRERMSAGGLEVLP